MMGVRKNSSTIELVRDIIKLREEQIVKDMSYLKSAQREVIETQEDITQSEKQLKDLRNSLKILESSK